VRPSALKINHWARGCHFSFERDSGCEKGCLSASQSAYTPTNMVRGFLRGRRAAAAVLLLTIAADVGVQAVSQHWSSRRRTRGSTRRTLEAADEDGDSSDTRFAFMGSEVSAGVDAYAEARVGVSFEAMQVRG